MLEPALEWVASSLSIAALLAEVKQSTRRISDLVAVVKSYSQMDRASLQNVDVQEGLESTLAVLAHEVGHIHAEHVLYLTAARLLEALASVSITSSSSCAGS